MNTTEPTCIVTCVNPGCKFQQRVPTNRGKLKVTCKRCRTNWFWSPPEEVPDMRESPASEASGMSKASKTVLTVIGVLFALFVIAGGTLYMKVHHYMQTHPGSDSSNTTLADVFGRTSAEVSAASQEATEVEQTEKAHETFAILRAIAVQNADTPEKLDAIKRLDELDRMLDDPKKLRAHIVEMEAQEARDKQKEEAGLASAEAFQQAVKAFGPTGALTLLNRGALARPGGNEQKAFQETKAKAEQGDVSAQYNLGLCYYSGEGVEKNYAEAYAWYNLASKTDKDAAKARDDLAKTMSQQQIGDAQKRTKELRAQIEARLKSRG